MDCPYDKWRTRVGAWRRAGTHWNIPVNPPPPDGVPGLVTLENRRATQGRARHAAIEIVVANREWLRRTSCPYD